MSSERTRLANTAVDFLFFTGPRLANKFESLIPFFIPVLLRLLGRVNKVFTAKGSQALFVILSNCHLPRLLVELHNVISDKSANLRLVASDGVLRCVTEWDWHSGPIRAKVELVEGVIRSTATDSNADVRKTSRKIFETYSELFPERVDK